MNEHFRSKGGLLTNWITIKKEATDMWMIIFERSKSYILKKKRRKKKERWKIRK